mgnify:FL=1
MGGGIATVLAPQVNILKIHKLEYAIITVIGEENYFSILVNFYCPPTTSKFAPTTGDSYRAILETIQLWIWEYTAAHGTAHQVLWIGDFNARTGTLTDPSNPDIVVNPRGRALAKCMGIWGYGMTRPPPNGDGNWTHRHMEGQFSVIDYAWHSPVPGILPMEIHNDHWDLPKRLSPHAILTTVVYLPKPLQQRLHQPQP